VSRVALGLETRSRSHLRVAWLNTIAAAVTATCQANFADNQIARQGIPSRSFV
jgi:hypothetical protein